MAYMIPGTCGLRSLPCSRPVQRLRSHRKGDNQLCLLMHIALFWVAVKELNLNPHIIYRYVYTYVYIYM